MPSQCQDCNNTNNATETLSARGVRLTELRKDVLQVLHHTKQPVGAYELFDQLKSDGRASAPPAVYRVLDFLVDQGLAHKLLSVAAYTACRAGPQPHQAAFLICRKCGDAEEFCSPPPKSLSVDAKKLGFRVEEITLEAHGLCKACV